MFALFAESPLSSMVVRLGILYSDFPKVFPVILLTDLCLYEYPGFFCSGFCYFLDLFLLEINLV